MKKQSKALVIVLFTLLFGITMSTAAHAGIYTGGDGAAPSGGSAGTSSTGIKLGWSVGNNWTDWTGTAPINGSIHKGVNACKNNTKGNYPYTQRCYGNIVYYYHSGSLGAPDGSNAAPYLASAFNNNSGLADVRSCMPGGKNANNVIAFFGLMYTGHFPGQVYSGVDMGDWKEYVVNLGDSAYGNGYFQQSTRQTYGSLLNLYKAYKSSTHATVNQDVVNQLSAISSQTLPKKTAICVTKPATPTITPIYKWDEVPVYKPIGTTQTITCEYSRSVTVSRQISAQDDAGNDYDPIGKDNLHDQDPVVLKTAFGNAFDAIQKSDGAADAAGKLIDLTANMKTLTDACNATKAAAAQHPKVTLDADNKAGLAEGGVLNVTETSQSATYTGSTSGQKFDSCTAYESVSKDKGKTWTRDGKTRACTGTYPPVKNADTNSSGVINSSSKVTGFWQMLSVHCNQAGFKALLNAITGETVVSTGDPSQAISAVVYSKAYSDIPEYLDFGDETNPNDDAAATASVGFYDKECPFVCTSSSNSADGASTANGALSNIGTNAVTTGGKVGKFGAVVGNTNNNSFVMFRDNKARSVKLDTWYPVTTNVVNYGKDAPITTTVSRWADGTPSIDGSDGGTFTMKDSSGHTVFTSDGEVLQQRDWDPTSATPDDEYLFNSPTSALMKGLQRSFTVQATFASDNAAPEVLNVKWEYEPRVATAFAVDNIGFTGTGGISYGTAQSVSTDVQGKCYANFGTTTQVSTVQAYQDNTGSDSTNNLDGHLLQGDSAANNQTSLIIKFVRSTTD